MANTKSGTASGLIPGVTEDNPKILEQISEEAAIKTEEQALYADANAANRAEVIAKNKAHAAVDEFESQQPTGGAYGLLSARATKIQSLVRRDQIPATAEDVAEAYTKVADASKATEEVLANV